MKLLSCTLFAFGVFMIGISAEAFNPQVIEPPQKYEELVLPIEEIQAEREYLGVLEGAPEMVEITIATTSMLTLRVLQKEADITYNFGVLVVRVDEGGGVSEIVRLTEPADTWSVIENSMLGMSLLESTTIEKSISPGTYRIEISTPVNVGEYMLVIGNEKSGNSYFSTLAGIYRTQQHFGMSWWGLFTSTYVYYPLGILLVVAGLFLTYTRRKSITNGS